MSTRKRRDPRSLEPEAPELYAEAPTRKRPAAGQKPPTLDEALASVAITVGVRLIERLLAPTPPHPPAARPVDFDQSGGLSQRTCNGNKPYCGARMVLDHWRFCPYCATELRAVQ